IGTNVQAYDADLTTYAGITPTANVQTLLGAADFAAFKTSLSLNNVENTAVSTWTGSSNITTLGTITALDVSGATTLDGAVTLGDAAEDAVTLTGNTTIDGTLKITSGTPGDGKVLTSDADGNTSWGAAPGGGDLLSTNNLSDLANAGTARTNLGLAIGTDVQAYDADLTTYAGITPSANIQSLLGSADYATARTNLGLAIGTNVQAYDADLTTYAGITPSANIQSLLGSADYATARTNLGLVIGTNVQAYDADLTTYAGITPSANVQTLLGGADFAAVKTSLSLNNVENTAVSTWAGSSNITTVGTITALDVSGATTLDGAVTLGDEGTDAITVTGATSIDGSLTITNSPTADGYVLTSDISGGAIWEALPADAGGDLLSTNNLSDVANATTATQNLGVEVGVDVQAYDADLTTYAGITPSANVQSLLGSADYATARTNLGVAIGSDVQAYDADLTTYAGITPSANVQTILGAADFAAVKTSLSLNNVENTAVSTWAGSANITTVGTITALDVSGATTLDGAVTLGDAAGDAIAVTGALQILSGTPGADKVLTSDASGNATWVTPAAASGFQVKKTSALTTSATFIDVTAWDSPDLTNTNISFNATTGEVTFGAAMDVSITVRLNVTATSNTDVLSSIQILVDTGGGYGAVTGSLETELACVTNNDPGSQTLSNFFMTVASGDKIKVQNNNGGGSSSITSGRISITTYL
ncbi:beta strand repeat-containing protein, partial [Bacteroidota bacterium]